MKDPNLVQITSAWFKLPCKGRFVVTVADLGFRFLGPRGLGYINTGPISIRLVQVCVTNRWETFERS